MSAPFKEFRALHLRTIPHDEQRYPTIGDWWEEKDGEWHIRVSDTGDWRHAFLVALHEQIEMALCKQRGITEQSVMDFDLQFEAARVKGNTDEPGDAPRAPYRREHRFSENIERLVAAELGVIWSEYEATLAQLDEPVK